MDAKHKNVEFVKLVEVIGENKDKKSPNVDESIKDIFNNGLETVKISRRGTEEVVNDPDSMDDNDDQNSELTVAQIDAVADITAATTRLVALELNKKQCCVIC